MKRILITYRIDVMILGLLILITGLSTFLRFYHIGKLSFWGDEIFMFNYSLGGIREAIKADPNMSLYGILTHFWVRIFPNASDGTLRGLSAIFSVASIPVVFLLGRKMTAKRIEAAAIGLVSAFLITLNAFHIPYAQQFRSYSLTFLLTTMSTYLLIHAIEDTASKRYWSIGYVIVTAAAVYSHFYAVFIIAAQAVTLPILLLDKSQHYFRWKQILFCGIGTACFILPITIMAALQGAGQIAWIPDPTLAIVKEFFVQITGNQGIQLFLLYLLYGLIGFLYGAGFGLHHDLITRWKFTLVASCFFVPVAASLIISKTMVPIFRSHYLLYVMPYAAILAAAGIVAAASLGWKRAQYKLIWGSVGMAGIVLFTLFSAQSVQSYFANYQNEDWRGASQYLTANCSESLRLYYLPFGETNVKYYNPALKSQKREWWINILAKNLDADGLAASLPKEFSQICLLSWYPDAQQEKMIRAAIHREFPQESAAQFVGIEIKKYQR